jgi:hypothetical protein
MKPPFAPREWSATLGQSVLAPLAVIYVFSLVPALLLGTAPLPGWLIAAAFLWTCGALSMVAICAYRLSRFRLDSRELLLPARRSVLRRTILAWAAVIVVLPDIGFWVLVPRARHWMTLITAAPVLAALSISFWLRHSQGRPEAQSSGNFRRRPPRSPGQVIAMFMGQPFMPFPSGARVRAGTALCLILWATPAAFLLISSATTWKHLTAVYLALTVILTWVWFMAALARFARDRPSNFAELALLPGLGDAARRRHALYRAILLRPMLLMLCGLTAYVVAEWWAWRSPARVERSVLCSIVLLMFCVGALFQLLSARGGVAVVSSVIGALVAPLVLSQTLLLVLPGQSWLSHPGAQRLFLILLAMLATAPATIIWIYTSGLAAQRHPFLAEAD